MKSKMCKGCRVFFPKGTTPFSYDVCNFQFAAKAVQRLECCPNGKPIYNEFKQK